MTLICYISWATVHSMWISATTFVSYDTSNYWKSPAIFAYNEQFSITRSESFYFENEHRYCSQHVFPAAFRMIQTLESELIVSSLTPTLHHPHTQPQQIRRMGGWLCSRMTTLSLSLQLAGSMGPCTRKGLILFHIPMHVIPLWYHIKQLYMTNLWLTMCVTYCFDVKLTIHCHSPKNNFISNLWLGCNFFGSIFIVA